MGMITTMLYKQLAEDNSPTPGNSTFAEVYELWGSGEGILRTDNIDKAVDALRDSSFVIERVEGEDTAFESAVLEEVACLAAKALVVLDLFDETGKIELQTQYHRQLEKVLHEYEERPPF